VFALPLRLRDLTIGALNLFKRRADPRLEEDDVLVAQASQIWPLSASCRHQATNETQTVNEQLTQALTSRVLIEQAQRRDLRTPTA